MVKVSGVNSVNQPICRLTMVQSIVYAFDRGKLIEYDPTNEVLPEDRSIDIGNDLDEFEMAA